MFDMSWNGGGITIGWGGGGYGGGYGGPYDPPIYGGGPYPVYPQQQTTISNGMLLVGAILLYFLLKK